MDILSKLVSPLKYLLIDHKQKRMVDIFLPLVFSLSICIAYVSLPVPFAILGEAGLISSLNGFVQIISGFFIAALGAIATFPNKNMDEVTDGIPLLLKGSSLTRRQFLSYMFGYLAFVGFFLVLLGILVLALTPSIEFWSGSISPQYVYLLKIAFLLVYFFVFNVLLLTTLYGLYHLTEKIHENKSEFTSDIGDASTEDEPENF